MSATEARRRTPGTVTIRYVGACLAAMVSVAVRVIWMGCP